MSVTARSLARLVLVLSAISGYAIAPAFAQETRLRAMTFNVRFDFEDDGKNRWTHRKASVARTIEASGASVVCLQEDVDDQVDDLGELLPEFEFLGRGRNANGTGERCSIAYRKRHLAVETQGSFWLSETPDEPGTKFREDSYPRVVTWALFRTPGGKRLLVLSTHLPEGDKESLRTKCARVIHDWLVRKLEIRRKGQPIRLGLVVAGDFNSDAGSDPHAALTEGGMLGLSDAWDAAKGDGFPGTYGGFEGMRTKKRIDWLLVGGTARAVAAAKVDEKVEGRYPSDHYPVHADLELR